MRSGSRSAPPQSQSCVRQEQFHASGLLHDIRGKAFECRLLQYDIRGINQVSLCSEVTKRHLEQIEIVVDKLQELCPVSLLPRHNPLESFDTLKVLFLPRKPGNEGRIQIGCLSGHQYRQTRIHHFQTQSPIVDDSGIDDVEE